MSEIRNLGLPDIKKPGAISSAYDPLHIEKKRVWLELLNAAIAKYEGESYVSCSQVEALTDYPAKYEADAHVNAWTHWSEKRVYFPAGYDGWFWVASVPRNPSDEQVKLVGGGCGFS